MEARSYFGVTDYVIFSLMLFVSAMIGVYYRFTGGKQQTTNEYLMADKNMPIFPVTCSIMASHLSGVTLLGLPREIYTFGTQFALISLGQVISSFFIAFVYLPVFFKLQKTSAHEYLEMRFGRISRLVVSGTFILQRALNMSVALYAPAIALSAVTRFSETASILSVGLVCTFYSTIGGMKAVLWTDVIQGFLMVATVLAISIKGIADCNGLGAIWNTAVTGGRIQFFDFNMDPTARVTFWTQVIGGGVTYAAINGVNQIQIQRLLTVSSLRKSQLALMINIVLTCFVSLATVFSGLVIYAKYYDCDPVLSKRITNSDQLLPLFLVEYLSFVPGLAGLLVSGIFGASLSSLSSVVNSLAAVTIEDFLKPILKSERFKKRWQSENIQLYLTKALACAYGMLFVMLAFIINRFGGLLQMGFSIMGITSGPILGIFSLGMLCPKITQRGAVVSFLIGITFTSWMGFGSMAAKPYSPSLPRSIDGCPAIQNEDPFIITNTSFINISQETSDLQTTISSTLMLTNFTSSVNEFNLANSVDRNVGILYIYRISFMWFCTSGFLIVVLLGLITTLCEKQHHVNRDLLSPACWYWYSNAKDHQHVDEKTASPSKKSADNKYNFGAQVAPVSHCDDDGETIL